MAKILSNKQGMKKNILYSTAYQMFNVLTPIITAPYLSRVLGADGIGIYSFTSSIQAYFILFATLGTMSYGTREISMNRDNPSTYSQLFWEIEIMTIVTSITALIAWLIMVAFCTENQVYYLILSLGIVAALFDVTWFFNGMEQFKITVLRNVVIKILGIICIFSFVKNHDDLAIYILIVSATTLCSSLALWLYLRRYLVKVNVRDFRFLHHFKETLVYFIPSIATSVYTVLDRTLIGVITKDNTENGYYQQAEKIIAVAKSIVFTAVNSVVGVRISYLFSEKKYAEIHTQIENSMNYIFFIGVGCCFGILAVAKNFVPLFFGPGYDNVVPLLYIFAPIIVIIGVSNCIGTHYYVPCGKRALSARFIVAGAVFNLSLNLVLIPKFQSYGAAIASVAAELLITYLYVAYSGDYGNLHLLFSTGFKKIIAGIIMAIPVYFLNYLEISRLLLILCQVLLGVIVYIIILIFLQDDWTMRIFSSVIKKIRIVRD